MGWNPCLHTLSRWVLVAAASRHDVTLPLRIAAISAHALGTLSPVIGDIRIVGGGLLVIALLGELLAAMGHTSKATTRLVSTFATAGILNTLLSRGENILVLMATTILSLFVPTIMLLLLVLFLLTCGPLIVRVCSHRWGTFGR